MQKTVYLHFSNELVDQPVMSTLIRKHNIDINIMEAKITPNEEGKMLVQLTGSEEDLDKALGYLISSGVEVTVKPKRLVWHEELCISCGACTGQCFRDALYMEPETGKTQYDEEKCVGCLLCIPACPYQAIEESAV